MRDAIRAALAKSRNRGASLQGCRPRMASPLPIVSRISIAILLCAFHPAGSLQDIYQSDGGTGFAGTGGDYQQGLTSCLGKLHENTRNGTFLIVVPSDLILHPGYVQLIALSAATDQAGKLILLVLTGCEVSRRYRPTTMTCSRWCKRRVDVVRASIPGSRRVSASE